MDRNTNFHSASLFDLPVALRKESVDRNYYADKDADWVRVVALRKESVDRNCLGAKADSPTKVALRKESVDRNRLT